jgi:hypothetical protein
MDGLVICYIFYTWLFCHRVAPAMRLLGMPVTVRSPDKATSHLDQSQ